MRKLIGVYGAAGCGRGIMPLLRAQFPLDQLVFIDDGQAPGHVNGHDILTWGNFLEWSADEKFVNIAIAFTELFLRVRISKLLITQFQIPI